MFGIRPKKALRNQSPSGYWCPICKSESIKRIRRGSFYDAYSCGTCGTAFEVMSDMSPEEYADDIAYGEFQILWKETTSPMYTVREMAIRDNPKIATIARDPEIFAWICEYWSYVQWNEHGNEVSYEELADQYFESIINELTFDPSGIEDYIRGDGIESAEQERLIAGLKKISKRCSR